MTNTKQKPATILVIGANGLIGKLLSEHLSSQGFNIIGIDKDSAGAASTRFEIDNDMNNELIKKTYPGHYFVADITNLEILERTFHQIIKTIGKPDLVIHLAAALESQDPKIINKVNLEGTENIFKICHANKLKKIIYTSSMTVVWDYTNKQPYIDILARKYQGLADDIPKITEDIKIALSEIGHKASEIAYKNSKIQQEFIANEWAKHGLSIIGVRLGGVHTTNIPIDIDSAVWCSHRDLCSFFELAISYFLQNKNAQPGFNPIFLCSANKFCWVSLDKAKNILGFIPQDRFEDLGFE